MKPEQLSLELRTGSSRELQNRRWIIGLSLVGAAMGQIVSLYQTGILKHLPDPPFGPFDSDRVDASEYAYKRLNTPDGFMMTVSYAATAWLAAAGGEGRHKRTPLLPLAMAAKIAGDVGVALQLTREEWAYNKRLCSYCQVATVCSIASAALTVSEVVAAARQMR